MVSEVLLEKGLLIAGVSTALSVVCAGPPVQYHDWNLGPYAPGCCRLDPLLCGQETNAEGAPEICDKQQLSETPNLSSLIGSSSGASPQTMPAEL